MPLPIALHQPATLCQAQRRVMVSGNVFLSIFLLCIILAHCHLPVNREFVFFVFSLFLRKQGRDVIGQIR